METHDRRSFIKIASGSAVSMTMIPGCLGGTFGGSGGDFPPSSLTFVNAYSEGGGVDTNFRQIQSYFEEYLEADLKIDYRDGAGTRIAAKTVSQNDDGTMIGGTLSPATPAAVAIDEAKGNGPDFTLDDLRPLGTISSEAAIIRVRKNDDRFTAIEDLVDYASQNPGELTVGASGPTNRNMLSMIQLMESTDAEFSLVPFEGGGPTQTALMQEEIDVAARSVYNSADIASESRCLAVYAEENPDPELTNDAPPINEALGIDIDYSPTNGTQYYYMSAKVADEHPDRYEHVQQALKEAHQDEDYRSDLQEAGEKGKLSWSNPDETEELLQNAYETYKEYHSKFEEYVQK